MAFDYGSIDLGIRNPFRIEGTIRAASGIAVLVLGVLALLSVATVVAQVSRPLGLATAGTGFLLTAWGLLRTGRGLFQLFRFFVGRSVPANLAQNFEKSQAAREDVAVTYTDQQLEQMLQGRQNLSFREPRGWFARLVHSLFRSLLYLPYAYRNMALQLARALTLSAIALLCYGLATFSDATGLADIAGTGAIDWLLVLLFVLLLGVWLRAGAGLSRLLEEGAVVMPGALTLTFWLTLAVLFPFAVDFLVGQGLEIPAMPFDARLPLAALLGGGVLLSVAFGMLIALRGALAEPLVEVAEYRDNWQESIHPQEVFIHFENIVMANRRYLEVPNRIYRGFSPTLVEQGSDDKGNFRGEMIQETQPVHRALEAGPVFTTLRLVLTVLGGLLACAVAVVVYGLPGRIAPLLDGAAVGTALPLITTCAYLLVLAALLRMTDRYSHVFWAEMLFDSLLVYFQCQGTYTESRLSTGAGIYDSTRSENLVVRSSMTPWVIAAQARTSTFASSGALNLELRRYILELCRAEDDLGAIIGELRAFVTGREAIASIKNEKDLDAASRIFQVNQQTRSLGDESGPRSGSRPPVGEEQITGPAGSDGHRLGDGSGDDGFGGSR